MNLDNLKEQVAKSVKAKRWQHTLGVLETAVKLATTYGADPDKAATSALLHDLTRHWSDDELINLLRMRGIAVGYEDLICPGLLHGRVAAVIAQEQFGISDQEVIEAISCHTLGKLKMSDLDKIIFIADMIEPNRSYPGVETLRVMADENLDRAVLAGFDHTLQYVISNGGFIHPTTVFARNDLWAIVHNK